MHFHTSDQPSLALGLGGHTCNWGAHICGLYETEQERDDILFGFLHAGDEAGDLQVYCPTERTPEDFRSRYKERFSDGEHLNDPERFQLLSVEKMYCPHGVFSPWTMDDNFRAFHARSQRNGRRNIRVTAEMVWALEAIPGTEHLMAYESRLNHFFPGKPWIAICLYNVTKFTGAAIMNVLRTHPYTISRGVVTENPYYMDPDAYLAQNAPEFLTRPEEHMA